MEHKCLIFFVFVGLICITLADHCGSRADAVPNDSDPNHSSSESSSSESSSDSCSDSNDHKCPDPNQEYSDCASVCPRTCSNWWNPVTCQACRAGCKCIGDLVLNKDNRCVPVSKCPKPVCEDPRREFTEYGSVCPPACPGVNDDRDCTYQFVAGCFCRKGLLEDGNGNCVDPSCCPVPECNDPKREYDECGTACPPTCQNLNETSVICTDQCVSGCFCKYPHVEDDYGECVEPCECPTPVCSDPNRHYESCGTACPETCENLGTEIICTDDCVSGCFCNDGLVEDKNGKCIQPCDCSSSLCEDPDKEYLQCGSACPVTCDTYGQRGTTCADVCVKGCFCKKGLIDDGYGKCIAPENCDKCEDPNRYYTDCGSACPISCKNWWYYDHVVCTEQCVRGCFCRDGLVEDGEGNCIGSYECPTPVCKDKNRVFNECGSSCPDSCENINNPNRICTLQCVPDCFCKSPLVEDGNGNCIDRSKCPNPTCPDINRYYTDCGSRCPKSCTNRCKNLACAAVCVEGCFCLPWLIDNGKGKCINPRDCPADACKCEGNAEWSECGRCDGTCETPEPYCPADCAQGCFCPKGWVRNNRDVCIPRSECPK